MSIDTKLHEEINNRFDELAGLKPDFKEYTVAVDALTKLLDRVIEMEKLDTSVTHNEKQTRDEAKARWTKIAIDAGLGVAQLALIVWGAKNSWKFEETGTITSGTGKKFMDKLFRR